MLWADTIVEQIKIRCADKIKAGKPIVIRDEKTLSGRVHIGSLRGVAIHGMISEILAEEKVPHTFLFELNDFDPMDGLPVYLDQKTFAPHMGKPLCDVPSPDEKAKNYAEYFGDEFTGVIKEIGYAPTHYRSSDLYRSGKYNDVIRMALDNAGLVREIYQRISGAVKNPDWLPLAVKCEGCGKIGSTKARGWDGNTVEYICGDFVEWAKGCGKTGRVSPFDGHAKLPWKVEWAAKFTVLDVDVEGGGKDHSTRGGSRDIADTISREVFKREPPINIPYEFVQVGGAKMSSSKGAGASSREVADLLPPEMVRTLLLQKEPQRTVEFKPDGDTVPILYDSYDRFAKNFWTANTDDFARLFPFLQPPQLRKDFLEKRVLARFSNVAFLVQMPHLVLGDEIEKLEEVKLDTRDRGELDRRAECAKRWLSGYAPENYKFEIQKTLPEGAKNFSAVQKEALKSLLVYVEKQSALDGQLLHTELHELKTRCGIPPKELFEALYISFLGKTSGPKAGWFLSVLEKDFLIKRLKEVLS